MASARQSFQEAKQFLHPGPIGGDPVRSGLYDIANGLLVMNDDVQGMKQQIYELTQLVLNLSQQVQKLRRS